MNFRDFMVKSLKDKFRDFSFAGFFRYLLFMFVVLLIQDIVITHFRILGGCAFIPPAVCVAAGMFIGSVPGAVFSLIMGFFADMSFPENTVMFTVLFPALAFFSAFVADFFVNRRFFAYMCVSFAAFMITGIVQAFGVFATDGISMSAVPMVILQTLLSLPFAVPVYYFTHKWYLER